MALKAKILLVDDHPMVREWLGTLINQQADMEVCGEADTAPKALQLVASLKPRVAVVDISMEGGSGLELIKNVKAAHPETTVIVLSMHDETLYAERALRAGARGYIMKREATKGVLQGIRTVLNGKLYVSEKLAMIIAEKFVDAKPKPAGSIVDQLSDRELEVFDLLGRGLGTRRIAEELHISVKTVQAFCARIKEKLQLADATELLHEALRWHEAQQR